jgi:hypothetical protein
VCACVQVCVSVRHFSLLNLQTHRPSSRPRAQALVSQVRHDHALLHERVLRLTGADGAARLGDALAAARREAAVEAAEAAEAASEASWESASEAGRCGCALLDSWGLPFINPHVHARGKLNGLHTSNGLSF